MSERPIAFKRMVLGLPQNPGDYAAVAVTAKLAELLRIDLVAALVEDATLIDIAAMRGIRELRPLEGGWRPVVGAQLAREIENLTGAARRLFAEAIRTCRIEATLSLARGAPAEVIPSLAMAEDIIVIIEPRNPAERVTQQFTQLVDAAFRAAAAVMIVPGTVARTTGPVVVIASGPEESSVKAALAIATVARERLVIVAASGDPTAFADLAERARIAGMRCDTVALAPRLASASALALGLAGLNERLIVMNRGTFDDALAGAVASLRRVPVLVTEPDTEGPAAP
jgi:hypothetical protein